MTTNVTLQQIAQATLGSSGLFTSTSLTAWVSTQEKRGAMVRLYRKYIDGEDRISLSNEMKRMMRMTDGGALGQFNMNYMETIVQTEADRLNVSSIDPVLEKPKVNQTAKPATDTQTLSADEDQRVNNPDDPLSAETQARIWIEELLDDNRFDALQGDVAEASLRDGDTYLLLYWDNDDLCVKFSHEPAYDGQSGMLVYYATRQQKVPSVALKIWHVGIDSAEEDRDDLSLAITYVNVYWPDRVEHWSAIRGTLMPLTPQALQSATAAPAATATNPAIPPDPTPYTQAQIASGASSVVVLPPVPVPALPPAADHALTAAAIGELPPPVEQWTMKITAEPIGMPVVPFVNRSTPYLNYGVSELKNAVPIQDSINRTLISAIMASELTAFGIYYAFGFEPPAGLTPGMWIKAGQAASDTDSTIVPPADSEEASALNALRIGKLDPSPLAPYLDELKYLKGELYTITRTPAPEFMGGDSISGESLKQRETPLLGKVKRAQVRLGNSWENVVLLATRIQQAYGATQPPPLKRCTCQWDDPEIRNDTDTITNAVKIAPQIGDRQFLRLVGKVYDWDEATISRIIAERDADNKQKIAATIGGNLPGFGSYNDFSGLNDFNLGKGSMSSGAGANNNGAASGQNEPAQPAQQGASTP